jgi:hypothetical protein
MNLYMMLAGGRHYLIAARSLSRAVRVAADLVQDLEADAEVQGEGDPALAFGITLQEAGSAPASMPEGPVDSARI